MGISLQSYRIRIGNFNIFRNRCAKKQANVKNTMAPITSLLYLVCVLLLYLIARASISPPSQLYKSHLLDYKTGEENLLLSQLICTGLNWSYGADSNKLAHSLLGNRNKKLGYKITFWNCRRKLVNHTNDDTNKLVDIKLFISKHQPHVFGVVESDLYSPASAANRSLKLTRNELFEKLRIEGYDIALPCTWEHYGQARVLVFVKSDLNYKILPVNPSVIDLPNVTLEIGIGREKKP